MKKLSLIVLALSLGGVTTVISAETISGQGQSYLFGETLIRVNKTESTREPNGEDLSEPGIGHALMDDAQIMAFSDFKSLFLTEKNQDDVYLFDGRAIKHSEGGVGIGKFNFSQVADSEVYYGDWSRTGVADGFGHTVYFSGKNSTTEVPITGQAIYTLEGINQFDGDAKLMGTFNADFADKSYTGSLQGQSLAISLDGNIEGNGTFSGSAMANQSVPGLNSGQFFGDNAEYVAGFTAFADNHDLDTAFGGSKN